jgi:hypothetical protein
MVYFANPIPYPKIQTAKAVNSEQLYFKLPIKQISPVLVFESFLVTG